MAEKSRRLIVIRCPTGASRRQGCDLEPQFDIELASLREDVLEMYCSSLVTLTKQDLLSCTTEHMAKVIKISNKVCAVLGYPN
jgi:hypothetical protein